MKTDKTRITAVRIRKLRTEIIGISQYKFADAIGVKKATVAFWECGHCSPIKFNLEMIAEVFGCSVEWLTGRENDEQRRND